MTSAALALIASMLSLATPATDRSRADFLALFLETLAEQTVDSAAKTNYRCITVGPKGIEELNTMLATGEAQKGNAREALEYLHTLRYFEADSAALHYAQLADSLLSTRAKVYQPFVKQKNAPSPDSRVWLRKSGRKVVEMVVMLRRERGQHLQIVNVTGDLSKDFIEKLMKM